MNVETTTDPGQAALNRLKRLEPTVTRLADQVGRLSANMERSERITLSLVQAKLAKVQAKATESLATVPDDTAMQFVLTEVQEMRELLEALK